MAAPTVLAPLKGGASTMGSAGDADTAPVPGVRRQLAAPKRRSFEALKVDG